VHNTVHGGTTGLIFLASDDWDSVYGSQYNNDPDANIEDNEIAYNNIISRYEEGITYDIGFSEEVTVREQDVVAQVNGNVVTLSDSGWWGTDGLYEGFYMVGISDRDDIYGHHAMIVEHTGADFTLAEPIVNLRQGDMVTIGLAFRHNWIHHNTVEPRGYPQSSIFLGGMALENLVEDNYISESNREAPSGISVHGYYGNLAGRHSVTGTHASEPCAFNIVRENQADVVYDNMWDIGQGSGFAIRPRNNAFYDNDLRYGSVLVYSDTYLGGNAVRDLYNSERAENPIWEKGVWKCIDCQVRDDDPTPHFVSYFESWPNFDSCGIFVDPYCGDGDCNGDDTCSSCPADCGECSSCPLFSDVNAVVVAWVGGSGSVGDVLSVVSEWKNC
jgi:hypothetical protein